MADVHRHSDADISRRQDEAITDPDAISICRIIIGVPSTVISCVTVTFFSAAMPTVTLSSGPMI
jgi:hypothetical protein